MFSGRGWRRLFHGLPFRKGADAAEVEAEIEFHLRMRRQELAAAGLSEAEAQAEALRRFGDVAEARRALTRATGRRHQRRARLIWLLDLRQDLTQAIRAMRRRPGLVTVATTILGLGLGLTLAVLAVVDRLVLHPLPWPGAERLTTVWMASSQSSMRISPQLSMVTAWRSRTAGVEWIEAHSQEELLLEAGESAELVQTRSVTPGLLPALGARIVAGRGIEPSDTVAGGPLVTLLSWGAWQRRYGGDSDVLGRPVRLDGRIAVVAGVLERGVDLTPLDNGARAEFWLPLGGPGSGERSVSVVLRRKPGVAASMLNPALASGLASAGIADEMTRKFPPAASDPGEFTDPDRSRALWLLTVAVGLVLAVAGANVAALLLGQAATRAGEFRVRLALGAGRGRLVRQLLTESSLLALLGGIGGWAVAGGALHLTRLLRPETLLQLDDVALDPRIMALALGLLALIALLFGLAPALAAARTDPSQALGGRLVRSLDSRFGGSLRRVLVIAQLAASLVLVNGAGLLIRSFLAERDLPVGFDPRGLAWIDLDISRRTIPSAAVRAGMVHQALDAVAALPGVTATSLAGDSPLGYSVMESELLIEGRALPESTSPILIPNRGIAPGYFETIGKPVEEGRAPDGRTGSAEVAIDRVTAERFFPGTTAIGRRIRFDRTGPWFTIVGVVPEQRALLGNWGDAPFVFLPPFEGEVSRTLMVRTTRAVPLTRISAVVRSADSRIRIRSAQAAEPALKERLAPRRFAMTIVLGFAGLALLLAAVGLYGVVALMVSQRTWELGVRLALGAAPSRVRLMVLRQGAIQVGIGLVIGLVLTAASGRMLRGLLSGVSAWDPWLWAGAALVLAAVGLLASWIPAQRASRVDPLLALRAE